MFFTITIDLATLFPTFGLTIASFESLTARTYSLLRTFEPSSYNEVVWKAFLEKGKHYYLELVDAKTSYRGQGI